MTAAKKMRGPGRVRPRCAGPECQRREVSRGLCSAHYQQLRRQERAAGTLAGRRALAPLATSAAEVERLNVVVRVEPARRSRWEREAKRLGLSLSEWARFSLDAMAKRDALDGSRRSR